MNIDWKDFWAWRKRVDEKMMQHVKCQIEHRNHIIRQMQNAYNQEFASALQYHRPSVLDGVLWRYTP